MNYGNFLMGYMYGNLIASQRMVKLNVPGIPTASTYLYGQIAAEDETPDVFIGDVGYVGAVLPNIDTVYTDELKKTHPCVTLFDATTAFGTSYMVYFSAGYVIREYDGYCGIGLSKGENDIISYTSTVIYGTSTPTQWLNMRNDYVDGYSLSNTLSDNILWTNTDIVLLDDTVYLSASAPIPVGEIVGYHHGIDGLPILPVWDMETYKYAVIVYCPKSLATDAHYELHCSTDPVLWAKSYTQLKVSSGTCIRSIFYETDDDWGEFYTSSGCASGATALWANYNFYCGEYDSDVGSYVATDELHLSATEPIPVYEVKE